MRFLADESCDFSVVRALRSAGYEVTVVAEISPRSEDTEVLRLAFREKRILLTEDKDFGQLVFAHSRKTRGLILPDSLQGIKVSPNSDRQPEPRRPGLKQSFDSLRLQMARYLS